MSKERLKELRDSLVLLETLGLGNKRTAEVIEQLNEMIDKENEECEIN